MSEEMIDDINSLQSIYVIYKSNNDICKYLFDSEIYELDIIYDEFYKILLNMRKTNVLKTTYLIKKLKKLAETNFSIFLNRYPKIKNKYSKKDPDSGLEFLEL